MKWRICAAKSGIGEQTIFSDFCILAIIKMKESDMKTRYDFAVQAGRLQALQVYSIVARTLRQSCEYSGTYGDMLNFESRRYLYNKLKANTELLSMDRGVENFYHQSETAFLGHLHKVEEQVRDLYFIDETTQSKLSSASDEVLSTLKQYYALDALFADAQTQADTIGIIEQKQSLLPTLSQNIFDIRTITEALEASRKENAENVAAFNQTITSNSVLESNQQQVKDVFLNTIAKGSYKLNDEQFDIIKDIAGQCPLEGGRSVYKARSLYSLIDETMSYEDACAQVSARSMQNTETENAEELRNKAAVNTSFKVYPNPAKDVLTIDYRLKSDGYIVLYDLYGKEVRRKALSASNYSINIPINNIQSGLYLLRIHADDSDDNFIEKILITK